MSMMLDKCAVAGDITQGIDRTGCWTCAITVIGGSSSIAVKLVTSDTAAGVYSDFKELVPAASADKDQYLGFVVDLHGAKKFIKVTGAVMATAVFGDCDHDVKAIAITAGEVPSGADLEDNKEVDITENGEIEITPTAGKDGMKKVTATVNVSGGAELEDNKAVDITENGEIEITPTAGKDGMKKVTATVNVSGGAELEDNKTVSITENGTIEITPSEGKDGMKKVTATVNVSGGLTYSKIALSDSIAKTVGATSSIEVSELDPWRIGAKGYGIGVANIIGKIPLTDLIALGSEGATVAVPGGPGELVLKLTATPAEITGRYNVTGEVVSVGSMYFGDSVQLVLLT